MQESLNTTVPTAEWHKQEILGGMIYMAELGDGRTLAVEIHNMTLKAYVNVIGMYYPNTNQVELVKLLSKEVKITPHDMICHVGMAVDMDPSTRIHSTPKQALNVLSTTTAMVKDAHKPGTLYLMGSDDSKKANMFFSLLKKFGTPKKVVIQDLTFIYMHT